MEKYRADLQCSINYRSGKTEVVLSFFLEKRCQMRQLAETLEFRQANLERAQILEVEKREQWETQLELIKNPV